MAFVKVKNKAIFAEGTFNSVFFSREDLEKMVENFNKRKKEDVVPPIVIGHSNSVLQERSQEVHGWIDAVYLGETKKGKAVLMADLRILDETFSKIEDEKLLYCSIEITKEFDTDKPWSLDALALLGADLPAFNGSSFLKKDYVVEHFGKKELLKLAMSQDREVLHFAFKKPFNKEKIIMQPTEEIQGLRKDVENLTREFREFKESFLKKNEIEEKKMSLDAGDGFYLDLNNKGIISKPLIEKAVNIEKNFSSDQDKAQFRSLFEGMQPKIEMGEMQFANNLEGLFEPKSRTEISNLIEKYQFEKNIESYSQASDQVFEKFPLLKKKYEELS